MRPSERLERIPPYLFAELDKKVRTVRAAIQSMLDEGLRQRKHVFW